MSASSSTADLLADRLATAHTTLALHWLERLSALLPVAPNQVFPSAHLLDHVPQIILEIAQYLRTPAGHEIAANTSMMAKAEELANLRFEQRASVHQLLREYELLSDVLDAFVETEVGAGDYGSPLEIIRVQQRISKAVHSLQRHTVDTFLTRYMDTIEHQTAQLRGFNRMVSHELRQPLGVLHLLARIIPDTIAADGLPPLVETLNRNIHRITDIVGKLERLARLDAQDTPVSQLVELAALARDAATQLEEMAAARGVRIEVDERLPQAEMEPGRAELVFLNLLANAVKYSDPSKADRFVRVTLVDEPGLAIGISDNGIGIPADRLAGIFDEFVRVHTERDAELDAGGLGLGLSIVRECMHAMGGTVDVQSEVGRGSTFILRWPPPQPAG